MPKDTPAIKYTSRDFDSIKNDLLEYAKRYYPETFKDFSEASFGAMMVDMVAYVGDILSFYLDYQANECFLDTATEYDNVIKLAKQFGYKFKSTNVSQGILSFFITVPAANSGAPDTKYMPILRKGSQFISGEGTTFALIEDVDFAESVDVLSDQEQRDKWEWELSKGIIDLADILMQKNPDLTREEAEEILAEKKTTFGEPEVVEAPENTLLAALAKPTE